MISVDMLLPLPKAGDFSPEYAYHLGIEDARWLGHKNPQRSFNRADVLTDNRTSAYFAGLREGLQVTSWNGVVMKCPVHWDKPGFDTPRCLGRATHIGIADYGGEIQVIPLCDRHTAVAHENNRKAGTLQGFPEPWAIVPISWL